MRRRSLRARNRVSSGDGTGFAAGRCALDAPRESAQGPRARKAWRAVRTLPPMRGVGSSALERGEHGPSAPEGSGGEALDSSSALLGRQSGRTPAGLRGTRRPTIPRRRSRAVDCAARRAASALHTEPDVDVLDGALAHVRALRARARSEVQSLGKRMRKPYQRRSGSPANPTASSCSSERCPSETIGSLRRKRKRAKRCALGASSAAIVSASGPGSLKSLHGPASPPSKSKRCRSWPRNTGGAASRGTWLEPQAASIASRPSRARALLHALPLPEARNASSRIALGARGGQLRDAPVIVDPARNESPGLLAPRGAPGRCCGRRR
jgi:hypothetical protein